MDYRLTAHEWKLIDLAYDCLKVSVLFLKRIFVTELDLQTVADCHGELLADKTSTIHRVFPLLERVQLDWESRRNDPASVPVKGALEAGLKNMNKWY